MKRLMNILLVLLLLVGCSSSPVLLPPLFDIEENKTNCYKTAEYKITCEVYNGN